GPQPWQMKHLPLPFDRNSILTYLPHSTRAADTGKEVDRGTTNGCNTRFSEKLPQSVRQSSGLHVPVLPASSGERPSLLLPPDGTWVGRRPPVERENNLGSLGREDHDWPLCHQSVQPAVHVGRDRLGLHQRHGRSDQAPI